MEKRKTLQILLIIAGSISVVLGTIGIVVPILPTTPFLLLAAACYSISSPTLAKKLEDNRVFGSYISHWRNHQGIPVKTKIRAIVFLWISLAVSAALVRIILVWAILALIGTIVTIHLVLIKSKDSLTTPAPEQPQKEIGQCTTTKV